LKNKTVVISLNKKVFKVFIHESSLKITPAQTLTMHERINTEKWLTGGKRNGKKRRVHIPRKGEEKQR